MLESGVARAKAILNQAKVARSCDPFSPKYQAHISKRQMWTKSRSGVEYVVKYTSIGEEIVQESPLTRDVQHRQILNFGSSSMMCFGAHAQPHNSPAPFAFSMESKSAIPITGTPPGPRSRPGWKTFKQNIEATIMAPSMTLKYSSFLMILPSQPSTSSMVLYTDLDWRIRDTA